MCEVGIPPPFHSFARGYPAVPASLVEETVLFPLSGLGS